MILLLIMILLLTMYYVVKENTYQSDHTVDTPINHTSGGS